MKEAISTIINFKKSSWAGWHMIPSLRMLKQNSNFQANLSSTPSKSQNLVLNSKLYSDYFYTF